VEEEHYLWEFSLFIQYRMSVSNDGVNAEERVDTGSPSGEGSGKNEPAERKTQVGADELAELTGPRHENGETLEIGQIFELLKNKRRRQVITFLKEQDDGVTTLDELAEYIAAEENDIDVSQLSSSQRKRVYIGLYQCHLPKMDDLGVIEYQKNRGIIELQDTTQLERYLADPDEETDGRTELVVAGTVAAVVAVGLTGLGPLAAVPAIGWTVLSLAALIWIAAF
jgi:hypothetical protein